MTPEAARKAIGDARKEREARACAVCNSEYGGSRLCAPCAKDPANADWVTGDREIPIEGLGVDEMAKPVAGIEAPIRGATELQSKILHLLLAGGKEKVQRRRADTGGVFSVYYRSNPMSYREIARALGCSYSIVRRVAQRFVFA